MTLGLSPRFIDYTNRPGFGSDAGAVTQWVGATEMNSPNSVGTLLHPSQQARNLPFERRPDVPKDHFHRFMSGLTHDGTGLKSLRR